MSEKILAELMDAVIRFDGRRLVLENSLVSRTVDFFKGCPETVSFRRTDLDLEFADPERTTSSFSGKRLRRSVFRQAGRRRPIWRRR